MDHLKNALGIALERGQLVPGAELASRLAVPFTLAELFERNGIPVVEANPASPNASLNVQAPNGGWDIVTATSPGTWDVIRANTLTRTTLAIAPLVTGALVQHCVFKLKLKQYAHLETALRKRRPDQRMWAQDWNKSKCIVLCNRKSCPTL